MYMITTQSSDSSQLSRIFLQLGFSSYCCNRYLWSEPIFQGQTVFIQTSAKPTLQWSNAIGILQTRLQYLFVFGYSLICTLECTSFSIYIHIYSQHLIHKNIYMLRLMWIIGYSIEYPVILQNDQTCWLFYRMTDYSIQSPHFLVNVRNTNLSVNFKHIDRLMW